MHIALIGHGKMGHIIEEVARERGHEIVCIIDKDNGGDIDSPAFVSADVAIEFSTPKTAADNVRKALEHGVNVVCGTTGWDVQAIINQGLTSSHGFIWSSNYSLGVNLLFALNRRMAAMMTPYPDYSPSITEIHHIHKQDAPSGTAKTLAEELLPLQCPVESIREGEVAGIHEVRWDSEMDTLTIRHEAKSRKGFAIGAVIAAEWIQGKKGFYTMQNVLGL